MEKEFIEFSESMQGHQSSFTGTIILVHPEIVGIDTLFTSGISPT